MSRLYQIHSLKYSLQLKATNELKERIMNDSHFDQNNNNNNTFEVLVDTNNNNNNNNTIQDIIQYNTIQDIIQDTHYEIWNKESKYYQEYYRKLIEIDSLESILKLEKDQDLESILKLEIMELFGEIHSLTNHSSTTTQQQDFAFKREFQSLAKSVISSLDKELEVAFEECDLLLGTIHDSVLSRSRKSLDCLEQILSCIKPILVANHDAIVSNKRVILRNCIHPFSCRIDRNYS
jgi:hypothetical protein